MESKTATAASAAIEMTCFMCFNCVAAVHCTEAHGAPSQSLCDWKQMPATAS